MLTQHRDFTTKPTERLYQGLINVYCSFFPKDPMLFNLIEFCSQTKENHLICSYKM